MPSWAETELKTIDLGDKRLNRRATVLVQQLAAKPQASIPQACGGWADTQAAYRFFAQEDIGWQDIMAGHWQATYQRMRDESVVLCIQDTTELNFNGQAIQGLGPLSHEVQRGMYLHPTYAVSPERQPLGVLDAWMWARQPKASDGSRPGLKESTRWLEGYERVAELAEQLPQTRLVYVADREADIAALMACARDLGEPADWLIRCSHNRALPKEAGKLWAYAVQEAPLGQIQFVMASRPGQKARTVRQHVWARRVLLDDGADGQLQTTCVVAREVDAPQGSGPVLWRLLTNRAITDLAEAAQLIDWYRARWEIEMFFHVLKNGCRVEALQLNTKARVERALALYMVVAWRVAHLMRLGRACPELDADLLFATEEWQAAYILNRKPVPRQRPKLGPVLRLVAQLGGFLGRKGDGQPGAKTIWLGLQRVIDFAAGVKYMSEQRALEE